MNAYTDLTVWDDETGERYWIDGHVNRRRALAAVNRYVRESTDHETRREQLGDVRTEDVSVVYSWVRPDAQAPGDDETGAFCSPDHPQAEAVTAVYP